jgi:DUF1365 family protein
MTWTDFWTGIGNFFTATFKLMKPIGNSLNYPLCFSFLDLKEIEELGSLLWPIFGSNYGWLSLCSFDYCDHLKGWDNNDVIKLQAAFAC